jgi:hypothetical protein
MMIRKAHLNYFSNSCQSFSPLAPPYKILKNGAQVNLEVHTTNIKAINLYKKFGFKHLGEYNVYIIRDISNLLS